MAEKKMNMPELWTAILSGQYALANQMIYNGANINETRKTKSNKMITLLHYVVSKSDVRYIRVLANLGADFNARDSKNRTPLHWAARSGVGPDVVEELINGGTLVDARDHNQQTALHLFAQKKRFCIGSVQKLIDRGASLEAVNAVGEGILHVAVWHHNLEMVKLLLSHRVNIDARDIFGRTPLRVYFSNVIENTEGEDRPEIVSI